MQEFELMPKWDARKSFYGKARVRNNDGDLELISYSTRVAVIYNTKTDSNGEWLNEPSASVYGSYSATTLRHIKEFLLQNGFKAENKKQILADYGTVGHAEHSARQTRLAAESAGDGRQNV
jgi:hypothetical protein